MTLGVLFVLITGLLLVIAAFLYFRTRSFLEGAVAVQGTVVDFEASHSAESGTTYRPVVEFVRQDGQKNRFTDSLGSDPPGFDRGESVPVKYDPSKPEKAKLDKPLRLYFVPGLLGGIGIGLAIAAVILLLAGGGPTVF